MEFTTSKIEKVRYKTKLKINILQKKRCLCLMKSNEMKKPKFLTESQIARKIPKNNKTIFGKID